MTTRTRPRPATQKVGGPYVGPYGASPVTHVAYCQSRHLHPERVTQSQGGGGRGEGRGQAVSIKLIDVSRDTMQNVQVSYVHCLSCYVIDEL